MLIFGSFEDRSRFIFKNIDHSMKKIAAGILACLMSASLSSAQKATQDKEGKTRAVIGLSSIYMRQQPDYESALETQELMGTIVEIVGEKSYWR